MEIEPDLSICTVAGKNSQTLLRLLRSIEDTADPVSFEIVVAEIEPENAAGLADEVSELLVIHTNGLTRIAALNQAIRHAQGRYLALLDPDVVILPGCLKQLIDFMDDTPDAGLAAPRILNAYGKNEPSVKNFPGIITTIFGSFGSNNCVTPTTTSEVDWSTGGFHLLRRECLADIGLLDETLSVCAELDLYQQARHHGWHSSYVVEAVTVHANPTRYQTPWSPGIGERLRYLKKQWLS